MRQLIRARFPLLYIQTSEETRVLAELAALFTSRELIRSPRTVYTWSVTNGFAALGKPGPPETTQPQVALNSARNLDLGSAAIFFDLHPWLGAPNQPADPQLVRQLRDIAQLYRDGSQARTLILVSPLLRLPPELEHVATIVDFPLPSEAEVRTLLDGMIERNSAAGTVRVDIEDSGKEQIAKAALGLTLGEAENAFARAMGADGGLTVNDVSVVLEEKRQIIRKSGLLEVVDSQIRLADIGGLANLKTWLVKRSGAWLAEAAEYALPSPKGVLVTGIPGCGKSLTAKAMASAWQIPLIRLDVGKVFAGLVGASEENMRTALKSAEAIAPCVLWIDEIEKGFGSAGGERDSGTSARVFASFLTWMQERTAAVFVIATANDISRLPPEFMRKGRFDEIFFIDLPTAIERVDIFRLHLDSRLRKGKGLGPLPITDELLTDLALMTEGFSGAEIEQAVIAACFDAFDGRRHLQVDDLHRSVRNTVPLSVTQSEQIAALREWADVRAVSASAKADRTGYVTPANSVVAPVPDAEVVKQRGGRPIES
ncbi:AAA family ATPase [Nakamurella antarctica]|uniref:Uncharacterized AAA domain-containing protein ycf46 n=1 Tax=Nakamurella antarctica TaxID=1902245 RepID=A0A3G9A1C0_9ACTN|nr:AAA family ATPase [Nakamurella antarctica]